MNSFPSVYIVVLNYNNAKDTIECINSLLNLQYGNYSIIVVDNASSDQSYAELNSFLSASFLSFNFEFYSELIEELKRFRNEQNRSITLVKAKYNHGYANGNNIGLNIALADKKCSYVWILNNDTVVDRNALASLVDYDVQGKENDKNYGLIGSKLIFYHSRNTVQCVGGRYIRFWGFPRQIGLGMDKNTINSINEKKLDYVSGASVFTTREFLDNVGLMDETYFLYFEELDWAIRAKKKSFELGYCNESLVFHKDGASTKEQIYTLLSSPFSDYHFTRSKLRFVRKFYKNYLIPVYFSFLLTILNRVRRKQFKNIPSIFNAIFDAKYMNDR